MHQNLACKVFHKIETACFLPHVAYDCEWERKKDLGDIDEFYNEVCGHVRAVWSVSLNVIMSVTESLLECVIMCMPSCSCLSECKWKRERVFFTLLCLWSKEWIGMQSSKMGLYLSLKPSQYMIHINM